MWSHVLNQHVESAFVSIYAPWHAVHARCSTKDQKHHTHICTILRNVARGTPYCDAAGSRSPERRSAGTVTSSALSRSRSRQTLGPGSLTLSLSLSLVTETIRRENEIVSVSRAQSVQRQTRNRKTTVCIAYGCAERYIQYTTCWSLYVLGCYCATAAATRAATEIQRVERRARRHTHATTATGRAPPRAPRAR